MVMRSNLRWLALLGSCLLLVASAEAQTKLRWKLNPGTVLQHEMTQDSETTMNVAGQAIQTKMTVAVTTLWNVTEVDSQGIAQISQSFKSIKFKANSPIGFNLDYDSTSAKEPTDPIGQQIAKSVKPLTQATFNFKLSPLGEISDVKIPEASQELLKQVQLGPQMGGPFSQDGLIAMIKESVVPLPADPVRKDSSWQHTNEIKAPPLGKMTNETSLTYVGITPVEGKKLDQISVDIRSKLTEVAENPMAQIAIKSQSEKGNLFFDNAAGRLSHSETTQNLVMDISAMGQKFEQTIKTVKKVKLSVATK